MNMVMIAGFTETDGVHCVGPPSANHRQVLELIRYHQDRLRALLDEPVVLTIHWENGDRKALVTIVPVGGKIDPNGKFETVSLSIPDHVRAGNS